MGKIKTIFNDLFENSTRILMLLRELEPIEASQEKLCALDFIVLYAKQFNFSDKNIQGNNPYAFSEYISRRKNMNKILNSLIRSGFINLVYSNKGYRYKINESGIIFVERLESTYSFIYQDIARIVVDKLANCDENELIDFILKQKGDSYEQILD